ncbi:dihydropteroate synthase [Haloarculaceae archaeon H-GB2-1]|nr:dihydropteroate synthase [Haloarculaceae archaeon H-GB1-1]MEA5387754.1 dihydropteroate synthase [Haloarculaceae archaeon H-GB11]MEA5409246.1 dihydropteroate synthase [Haloarculaceae archaeon H-GB2-1]
MEFHEAANVLFEQKRPPELGTERTRALLEELGNPQDQLRVVQIAGTNGKGSTARMVERVLREAGLDVGLFTSPHMEEFRESVRINGRKVTKAAVAEYVADVSEYVTDEGADGDSPTYFELLVGLACREFTRTDVDVAIFEVGMGGARDATSALDPVASAVTAVSVDHAAFLGETVAEIAYELAGVAPKGRPLVTGASGHALSAVRQQVGDILTVGTAEADLQVTYEGIEGVEGAVVLDGPDFHVETKLPLVGEHQAQNAGVAALLARQVADVTEDDLALGLRNAHWPGRFEIMGQDPLVVLDGAHNPASCERVAETLDAFEYEDLHLVVGAMGDKDVRGMAAALPAASAVVATAAALDRAEEESMVARAFEREQPNASVTAESDVATAFERARERAEGDDCVLVTGSLAVVAETRTRWTRAKIPKDVDDVDDAHAVLKGADVPDADAEEMQAKAVHRVRKLRVQQRQAQELKEELLELGGECAISGLAEQDQETLEVVAMGTLAQFERLAESLDDEPHGLSVVGEDIRESLGLTDAERNSDAYPWDGGTAVMGILNATPDSFHDGGEYDTVEAAVERATAMVEDGADIIDVGGESTRPGADPVPVEDEIERVVPVVEALNDIDVATSVDTRKAAVARAALDAGADILNDVSGLEDPEMRLVAGEYDVPVVVMHSIDTPVEPDNDIEYDNVVEDVIDQLTERVLLAEKAGLDREQIVVDPGIGFGKTPSENFELLGRVEEFRALGCPVLVGHSHKSLFSHVGKDPEDRYEATVAGTAVAAEHGADIVRVHDVEANATAVDVVEAADDPEGFE